MARSEQTAWVMEILEGPRAGQSFLLVGREMPYKAGAGGNISFGKTQRTNLTWYPGNRFASQQILGPIIKPTTINGVWKEHKLGTDRPIQLVEAFEELLESGAQVRMLWQTIERQGVVKDFDWKPGVPTGGLSDIAWQAVFEWSAPAVTPPPRTVGDQSFSLRDSVIRAVGSLGELGFALENFAAGANYFVGQTKTSFQATRSLVQGILDNLSQPIVTLSSSAAQIGDEPRLPARIVESATSAAADAIDLSGQAAEVASNTFPGDVAVADDLVTVLNEALNRYDVIDAAFDALEETFNQRVKLEELVRPDQFASIPVLVGGDLREVAIDFYGNADLWPRIAKANGLDGSLIPDGIEEIVVPLSLPDATDDSVGC